jgi:hypothetical protein
MSDRFFTWSAKESVAVSQVWVEDEKLAHNESVVSEAFSALLDTASTHGIKVAALYGWNNHGAYPLPTASVLAFVDNVLALPDSSALTGVHFDIEPGAGSPGSYQLYADLLPQVRAKFDIANKVRDLSMAPHLNLSIAGSWGYASQRVSCGAIGANVSMLDCAVTFVDTFVLMNYRNNAYGCNCRPPPGKNPAKYKCPADGGPIPGNCTEGSTSGVDGMIGKAVASAQAVKASSYVRARLSLGVETSCFPAGDSDARFAMRQCHSVGPVAYARSVAASVLTLSPWACRYQYKLSFCNTSTDYMLKQMQLTEAGLRKKGLWNGVVDVEAPWAVEDYTALRALEEAEARAV